MLKRLFSTELNTDYVNIGLLLLRILLGFTMLIHGYDKLINFSEAANDEFWSQKINFLGLGGKVSLGLVVFAEFFCALFLILGFATRFSLIVLIICMFYAFAIFHKCEIFEMKEEDGKKVIKGLSESLQYLIGYIALLFTGPGRFSIDRLINKK